MNINILINFVKSTFIPSEKPRVHKQQTLAAYLELRKALNKERGLDLDILSESVRDFFVESQSNYFKSIYQSAIASTIGLDLSNQDDMKTLLKQIARDFGVYRKLQSEWLDEQTDPSIDILISYMHKFALLRPGFEPPYFNDFINSVKTSAAKTITFIRVFPSREGEPHEEEEYPKELKACWAHIKQKNYYIKGKNRPSLKHQAFDYIKNEFGDCLWFGPEKLGKYLRWVDDELLDENENDYNSMFLAWAVFKYSTFVRIDTNNYEGENPHNWLWNSNTSIYNKIWEIS